ncbi:MAG TPA: HAD-IIB family hydrolase [Myxococcales bacterium]|nr:HAD-IIB family hydrolase [Myxococcales bacterium]
MPRPLSQADLSRVRALLADVDGTLTTGGLLRAKVVRALERLRRAGVRVVLVTGRPSGWAECWVRTLPVAGAVAENGGLYLAPDGRGGWRREYAERPVARRRNRRRLWREVRRILRLVAGARLSSDSVSTEVDLAIDYAEQARLPVETADWIGGELARRGVRSARSSVHVNCWVGPFDKLTTSDRFLRRELRLPGGARSSRVAYVGDSINDAPMFAQVPLSVGVANVMDVMDHLPAPPRFVTAAREGDGFIELAFAILRAREERGP